jgi:hypothetical protein
MGIALLYPEPEKGGRGKKAAAAKALETSGFSQNRLKDARPCTRAGRPAPGTLAGGLLCPYRPR